MIDTSHEEFELILRIKLNWIYFKLKFIYAHRIACSLLTLSIRKDRLNKILLKLFDGSISYEVSLLGNAGGEIGQVRPSINPQLSASGASEYICLQFRLLFCRLNSNMLKKVPDYMAS